MTKRFFKLLYAIGLIAIVVSLPVYALSSIHWDRVTMTSYKAKCLSNNQYVVLQGAQQDEVNVMSEAFLNGDNEMMLREQLNFYCKYYDEIQPHIMAYIDAKTPSEKYNATLLFRKFENSVAKAYVYPELYKLEVASEEIRPQEVYNPLLVWLMGAIIAFFSLQIIRICYVYVVYGQLVWHPFRKIDNN